MPSELDLSDVEAETVERDENGNLVTKSKNVEWNGETRTLEVKPVTGGLGNRIAKHEEGLMELEPQAVAAVLSAACPALEDIRAHHVKDMPMEKEMALVDAIVDEFPDEELAGEGNPSP